MSQDALPSVVGVPWQFMVTFSSNLLLEFAQTHLYSTTVARVRAMPVGYSGWSFQGP